MLDDRPADPLGAGTINPPIRRSQYGAQIAATMQDADDLHIFARRQVENNIPADNHAPIAGSHFVSAASEKWILGEHRERANKSGFKSSCGFPAISEDVVQYFPKVAARTGCQVKCHLGY